ncbi:hypothetical protein EG68_03127 [Paragonimus skrjabini miyazakii]|uniref:Uncharacterized protein n=1 Tax=Paragonimus skrjabini miyazakii TaxID=59628 RepID=A0A8S9Z212_9TREM|nr:hypothetical protein EG68_03127 [Paragonimus skrjabini miyazakii]
MGAGYTKLLAYLDVGPEIKEDKLKKKYTRILTTGATPKKPELIWKSLPLDAKDDDKCISSLLEGAEFIHHSRIEKQNLVVLTQAEDTNPIAFATAYFMILSGLSVSQANDAIVNALKETDYKINNPFAKALQKLRNRYDPYGLRAQLFERAGNYSIALLSEDVNKIYELASLPQPTLEQIKLQSPASPIVTSTGDTNTKETVILSPQESHKPLSDASVESPQNVTERQKSLADVTANLEPSSTDVKQLNGHRNGTSNDPKTSVSEGLRSLVSKPSFNGEHSVKPNISESALNDLLKLDRKSVPPPSPPPPPAPAEQTNKTTTPATTVPHVTEQSPVPLDPAPVHQNRRKVKIVGAYGKMPANDVQKVDEYLANTSEEERRQFRKHVSIIRSQKVED